MADPNVKRMSAKEGRAFNGSTEITSLIKLEAIMALETTSKRVIGQKGMSTKVIGYDITGTITQYKATTWLRELVKAYVNTGIFPTFDIQAVLDDPDSDFVANHGDERIQLIGVQITGDIPLIGLDAEGEEVQEEISFSAAEVRWA